jgi:tetratricopeptide (TPR) repeat protein
VLPEQLAGDAELQDWVRAEHQVVLQAIAQAAAAGFITRAWQIFHNHAWLVGGAGYWADIRAVGQPVLDAAEAAGDQVALGWTHAIIGRYGAFLGTGAEDLARALGHFRQAGDLSGQAWAHLFASVAYGVMSNWAEGVTQSEQALALFRQTGELGGQGWALAGLGEWHARLGNYEPARSYAQQALEAGPATGDPTSLAIAWEALGLVHSQLGEPRQAISCYRQGLAFIRELKHPMGRALLLSLLAGLGTPAGPPGICSPPSRRGSRRFRSSTTWDGRTSWAFTPGSTRSARPARRADSLRSPGGLTEHPARAAMHGMASL